MPVDQPMTDAIADEDPSAEKTYKYIDCDVHHILPDFATLMPYIEPGLRRRIELASGARAEARNNFQMPRRAYFNPTSTARLDTMDADGTNHASVPQRVIEDLLDRYDITYAILMGNNLTTISGMPDPDLAAGITRAYNDWTDETWIRADPRFKHSIWVAPQDPVQAAAEIERWGDDPNVVQVAIGQMDILAGKRHYWPIYEAAARHNLPVAFHVGAESAGNNGPQLAVGAPTHYIELQTGVISIGIQNTISLVCEGVFARFPTLKVALLEYGWTWLPGLMWRLDREWISFRTEVPWVVKPPSEYIKEHIRVGSQPLEAPAKEHLHQTLEMMGAERMMLFATDYPHWDFDDPGYVMGKLPAHMRQAIAYENARALYGL